MHKMTISGSNLRDLVSVCGFVCSCACEPVNVFAHTLIAGERINGSR